VGKALAYGHSYTGNPLGCIAAKASLEIFEQDRVLEALQPKIEQMRLELGRLGELPMIAEVRQCGFIAGIELKESVAPGKVKSAAAEVCLAARRHGLLTRPIRNVVVLMPALCITPTELTKAIDAIRASILEVCGSVPA
jgi:adenosylmethionine-8-amino-7-oxononanoate aminotransferase